MVRNHKPRAPLLQHSCLRPLIGQLSSKLGSHWLMLRLCDKCIGWTMRAALGGHMDTCAREPSRDESSSYCGRKERSRAFILLASKDEKGKI